jgi:hypothetical protein
MCTTTAWCRSLSSSGCDHRISKNLTPFGKAAIRRQYHRALLVAGVDQLEKQVAGGSAEAEITDLIDDQQRGATEESDPLA